MSRSLTLGAGLSNNRPIPPAAQRLSSTPRWSQRRLPLPPSLRYGATGEFMDGLSYTTVIEPAEPLARRRGSALDR
jgi:hypothetical protein